MTRHGNALVWGTRALAMAAAITLLASGRLDAGAYRLSPVGGTIRSTEPGVWAVLGGNHVSQGLGHPYCAGGTIHVPVDGDADGFGSVTPDSVYARLGYTAGLSISPDEFRINAYLDGTRVDCGDAQPMGANWWISAWVPVR